MVPRVLRGKFSHGQTTFSPPCAAFPLPRHRHQCVYGDTCTVDLDLGLSITLHKQKIRLNRINAPELRGRSQRRGRAARDFLRGVIQKKEVLLQTIKDRKGKYGRYLGEIWVKQGRRMVNVNDLLVTEGHAKFVEY